MTFKENLVKKLTLDRLKQRVLATLGPVGSGCHVDAEAMAEMLGAAGYRCLKLRGLALYLPEGTDDGDTQTLLVLDNDLPMYHTTVGDVALRKEPTVKEMISIRNAIKILNDADVVVSRKGDSVAAVHGQALSRLDLSFCEADIKQLEYEGRAAVEWKDTEGVLESLRLFGELLGLVPEPGAFRVDPYVIRGRLAKSEAGDQRFGPAVVFHLGEGTLAWVNESVGLADKEGIRGFMDKATGARAPDLKGTAVIRHLAEAVMRGLG